MGFGSGESRFVRESQSIIEESQGLMSASRASQLVHDQAPCSTGKRATAEAAGKSSSSFPLSLPFTDLRLLIVAGFVLARLSKFLSQLTDPLLMKAMCAQGIQAGHQDDDKQN